MKLTPSTSLARNFSIISSKTSSIFNRKWASYHNPLFMSSNRYKPTSCYTRTYMSSTQMGLPKNNNKHKISDSPHQITKNKQMYNLVDLSHLQSPQMHQSISFSTRNPWWQDFRTSDSSPTPTKISNTLERKIKTGSPSATITLTKQMKTTWFSTRNLAQLDVCTNGSIPRLTESKNFYDPAVKDNPWPHLTF